MRITVVGALLIVVAAIAVVLVVLALIEKLSRPQQQNQTQFAPPGW